MENQRDRSEQAYSGNRKDIPIVAIFCILHQISADGFDLMYMYFFFILSLETTNHV